MIQESGQDNFRSCLRNFLSGARKKNIKDMSKPFSKIFLRTVPHPVQKILPFLYWNIFHEKESGTSYQHTVKPAARKSLEISLCVAMALRDSCKAR